MSSQTMYKLAVCCLNISEGRNMQLIDQIAHSAVQHQPPSGQAHPFKCETTVLSVYSDPVFNRANITIASTIGNLAQSVYNACAVAYQNIDLCQHLDPKHPRLGVVDLIPIHPISPSTSIEECSHVAHQIGQLITSNFSSQASVFYFGKADHGNRDLVERRKGLAWFSNDGKSIVPDVGTFTKKFGITGIGALPYMSVLNVVLDTNDVNFGKDIASNVRQRNKATGLEGVQAMAFPKGNKVEIACNVDTNDLQSELSCFKTTFEDLEQRIEELACQKKVKICGETVRGFTPSEAYEKTEQALLLGETAPWKHRVIQVM